MDKLKTKKAITKRFKITKTGKVMRRAVGQDHGLAKISGKRTRKLRRWIQISGPEAKVIKRFLRY